MRIIKENINNVPISEANLLLALLNDIDELNKLADSEVYVTWQEWHDDFDELPDMYGTYRLHWGDETIGLEMNIYSLDDVVCSLINFNEIKYGKNKNI